MKAVLAQMVSCCVYDNPIKIMPHMYGNIPYLFVFGLIHLIISFYQKAIFESFKPHRNLI